ncbi:hypothetical protein [Desulfonatronum parangueonense]
MFLFSPANFIFENDDANYIKLSERYLSKSLTSLAYVTFVIWVLMGDIWLLLISFIMCIIAIYTSKFSRQVVLFVFLLFSFLVFSLKGIGFVLLVFVVAFLLSPQNIYNSFRDQINHLRWYYNKNRYNIYLGIRHIGDVFKLYSKSKTNKEKIVILLTRDPARLLFMYPLILLIFVSAILFETRIISLYQIFSIIIASHIIYLLTSFRATLFLGECYRYIDYTMYFMYPLIFLFFEIPPSFLIFSAFIMVFYTLSVVFFTKYNDLYSNSYVCDDLSIFLDKAKYSFVPSETVVLGIPTRLAEEVLSRIPELKICHWQQGILDDNICNFLYEDYPFIKKKWWPIIERCNVSHLIVDKHSLRQVAWNYPFHELDFIFEDNRYALFSTEKNKNFSINHISKVLIINDSDHGNSHSSLNIPYNLRKKIKKCDVSMLCNEKYVDQYSNNPYINNLFPFDEHMLLKSDHYKNIIIKFCKEKKIDIIVNVTYPRTMVSDIFSEIFQDVPSVGFFSNELSNNNYFYTKLVCIEDDGADIHDIYSKFLLEIFDIKKLSYISR